MRYLGGHAGRDQPVQSAGLLLDRRGVHLRAFKELFSISWESVRGIAIEGPADISERLSVTRLHALGARPWTTQVAYLTVNTTSGDAIFEVDGLGPPELHARLSRVLQGLQRRERPPASIALERPRAVRTGGAPVREVVVEEPQAAPGPPAHEPIALDPATSDVPLEVLIVDALWKLGQLRDRGLVDAAEAATLRAQLLARVPGLTTPTSGAGPLLRV